jgi:hypothetical protein
MNEDELDNLAERINILLATADWTQAEEQHWTATDLIMEWIMPYLKADTKVITAASPDPENGAEGSQNATDNREEIG